jgi:Arc/MetJ-type ribon-helix-helix transcriptional regulator
MTTVRVAVRLPEEQVARIDRLAGQAHTSRSEFIRRAVELYLYRLACEHDALVYERRPLSDAELSLADDVDAWEHTPAW